MKALFLDMDGVVNRFEPGEHILPELAARIDRIVEACAPLYVVLSSSWREDAHFYRLARERFVIYDKTPSFSNVRGQEIAQWLEEHPEFDRYAILDDWNEFLPGQPLFSTQTNVGITLEIAYAVIAHLNGD